MPAQGLTAVAALLLALTITGPAGAITVHDESVPADGDFSGNREAPTPVVFVPGSNDVFGTTGKGATGADLDYFTFTIPHGYVLDALIVLNSVLGDGASAFIGLQSGSKVTVVPGPTATAEPLLGWDHFAPGDVGSDILPDMSTAAGAQHFTIPLGEGTYSVWIQDGHPAPSIYGLRFEVAVAPLPGTALLTLAGFASIAGMSLWRQGRGRRATPPRNRG
jgi:hypothetical protein